MKSISVAVCSHQRRDSIVRLVEALDQQAHDCPTDWADVEVVVALDGSDDGSQEALLKLDVALPLEVVWRPHRGLSAARNECLSASSGQLIYFLDDDLIPRDGTLARHRSAHAAGSDRAVLGPCIIPDSVEVADGIRQWWDDRYAELAASGRVTRFDQFSIANATLPRQALLDVGGFSTEFQGYGFEDYELGLRLTRAGLVEYFEPEAVAWHYTDNNEKMAVVRNREIGRNTVRLLRLHPDIADQHFPAHYPGPSAWLVDVLPARSPKALTLVSDLAGRAAAALGPRAGKVGGELRRVQSRASYAAGVADLDPTLLPRALGRPAAGRTWTWRATRR